MVKRKTSNSMYNPNDPYLIMGDRLRKLRKNYQMTIADLAEKLDLSNKMISNYENGYNRMTIDTIIRIYRSNVFGERSLEELVYLFIVDVFE